VLNKQMTEKTPAIIRVTHPKNSDIQRLRETPSPRVFIFFPRMPAGLLI
jgi:hypothetical protein